VLKLNGEFKVEFDFGNDLRNANGEIAAPMDFTGKEPLGKCPKCGAPVFDAGMNYVCEKASGLKRTCNFRPSKIILQQEIAPEQMKKLLETGKTDLLTKFVSKRNGRPFKAFLVAGKDGKIGFEFPPRESDGKAGAGKKSKGLASKIDFTSKEPLGKCPRCGGNVFETDGAYLCEKSQAIKKPCKFRVGKTILEQPIEPPQLQKVLSTRKTDLLHEFVSKAGRHFPAYLVIDDEGKVTFEFPPRKGE
jgi:uncharacterized C2H2 Zn-finger protein